MCQTEWFNPSAFLDRVDPSLVSEGYDGDRLLAGAANLAGPMWDEISKPTGAVGSIGAAALVPPAA